MTLVFNASTDDGAVASYSAYRDGVLISNDVVSRFIDQNLSAATQYCYEVIAVDCGGNTSLPAEACTTTSWQRSVVIANEFTRSALQLIGERNALAIDAADNLHIGYSSQFLDLTTGVWGPVALRYANNASGAWSELQISSAIRAGYRAAIAVDSAARISEIHTALGYLAGRNHRH